MTTKDKVLEQLVAAGGKAVSGELLAAQCDVSRAAIWKAVSSLRKQGFSIEGSTNGGYVLSGEDICSPELFAQAFSDQFPEFKDCHTEWHKEIDSTNTYAKRLLSECGNLRTIDGSLTPAGQKYHQAVIVAESQTAGRGRLGRSFVSPDKTGIYLSIIYAPEGGIREPALITSFAAVAVCRAIKRLYKAEPAIKWINDIFIDNGGVRKKVVGILTEGMTNFEMRRIESAIIGIGINIKPSKALQGELKDIAGFIEDLSRSKGSMTADICGNSPAQVTAEATAEKVTTKARDEALGKAGAQGEAGASATKSAKGAAQAVSRCQLAAEVAGQVLKIYDEPKEKVIAEYKKLMFLIGQKLEVHPIIGDEKSVYTATAIDVDDNAELVVELEDGSRKTLSSGEVSLKSANFTK
ncbi:MAG: biotin--[acetyl-CoA-carboxylase] ligase [Treponemataceae bacterium]|nr:biotin--[acetyl-CoA-carboxylase] ligase [Treponemataceae bacterium]